MTLKSMLALACAASTLAACQGGTIYKKDQLGDVQVLSVDARQRLVLQGIVDGKRITCTEPSPDAISAQAAQLAASASATVSKTPTSARFAGGYSEAVASIAMRTQTIQLLRDGYFRLCEARMNDLLDADQYKTTIAFVDEFIATVTAIEAIGGIVQSAPVAIYAGGSATAAENSAQSDSTPKTELKVAEIKVDQSNVDKAKADAIEKILQNYYKRKAAYHAFLVGAPSSSGQTD